MKKIAAALVLVLFLCTGCASSSAERKITYALGTECIQQIYIGDESVAQEGEALLYEIDAVLNFYRQGSEVYEINEHSGERVAVSPRVAEVIRVALEISRQSGGAFDVTMGGVSELWGFSNEPAVPDKNAIAQAIEAVGYQRLRLEGTSFFEEKGQKIDLGGIGKGYAADQLAALYRERGVNSAILNLGGNVYILGKRPDGQKFRAGIVDPMDPSRYFAVIELEDESIVTSGAYEKNFTENGAFYHHILDPKTGYPVENTLASVSIISKDSILADGLSTAAFVLGEEQGMELVDSMDGVEAVFVTKDKEILYSKGFLEKYTLQIQEDTGYVEKG